MNQKIQNLVLQYNSIKPTADNYQARWRNIAMQICQNHPILDDRLRKNTLSVSPFPITILRQLQGMLVSQMVNTDAKPIKLKPSDSFIKAVNDIGINLQDYAQNGVSNLVGMNSNANEINQTIVAEFIEKGVYNILSDSDYNVHEAFKSAIEDYLLFGNTAIEVVIGKDDFSDFSFKRILPDKIVFTEDRLGRVDKIFRNIKYTISQVLNDPLISKHSEIVKDIADYKDTSLSQSFEFLEAIIPNENYQEISFSKKKKNQEDGVYQEEDFRYTSYLIYKNIFCVKKSGYKVNPIIIARYKKEDGVYSPSLIDNVLGAIIEYNEINRAITKYAQQSANPALIINNEALESPLDLAPGSYNYMQSDRIDPRNIVSKVYEGAGDMKLLLDYSAKLEQTISEGLMYSEVMRGQQKDGNPPTALEVKTKVAMGLNQIASVALSVEKQVLKPLISSILDLIKEKLKILGLPYDVYSLLNVEVKNIYSDLYMQNVLSDIKSITQSGQFIAGSLGKQDTIDWLNTDGMMKSVVSVINPLYLNSDDDVKSKRDERQKAQEAQLQMQQEQMANQGQ